MSLATHGPIDFLAYDTDNHVFHARVDLVGDRLADLLAHGSPIPAGEMTVRDLRTEVVTRPLTPSIDASTLSIVVATGPRGALRYRVETECEAVSIYIGRYVVHGYVHAPVPLKPLEQLRSRRWLPVTEAVLEHHACGRAWRERFSTLLVNQEHAKAIVPIDEKTHEMHWLAGTPPMAWAPELIEA